MMITITEYNIVNVKFIIRHWFAFSSGFLKIKHIDRSGTIWFLSLVYGPTNRALKQSIREFRDMFVISLFLLFYIINLAHPSEVMPSLPHIYSLFPKKPSSYLDGLKDFG